ncbi:MAG: DUF6600 domain-containing protein [Verrucomicrobiota bacterium]
MKTFLKTIGLSFALALAITASPARAQDSPPGAQDSPAPPPPTTDNAAVSDAPPANGNAPSTAPANATGPVGDGSVSFQTFYDGLAPYGNWINTDKYGYVFQPTESNSDWRPYTYGHWVNSDAGMTWVGDDPFSWATDHYGRWVNLENYGWVWVPGYTWAPAWVSWRQGDEDVGWAPLPPDSDQGIDYYGNDYADWDYGYHIGDDSDLYYGIGPWWYNFCPIVFIGDPFCFRHFYDRHDNFRRIGPHAQRDEPQLPSRRARLRPRDGGWAERGGAQRAVADADPDGKPGAGLDTR